VFATVSATGVIWAQPNHYRCQPTPAPVCRVNHATDLQPPNLNRGKKKPETLELKRRPFSTFH